MPDPAYLAALKMLGGRELSERQVRQRLQRQSGLRRSQPVGPIENLA